MQRWSVHGDRGDRDGGTTESGANSGPATTMTITETTTGTTTLETGPSGATTGAVACRHRMFVSRPLGLTSIPTLADSTCQGDADNNDLRGEWIAIVPMMSESARDRFGPCAPVDRLASSEGNAVTVVVENPNDFWSEAHEGPINVHATGENVAAAVRVFSGSNTSGDVSDDCDGWTNSPIRSTGGGNPGNCQES